MKRQIVIRVPDWVHSGLANLSRSDYLPPSTIARLAIIEYLQKRGKTPCKRVSTASSRAR